MQLQVSENSPRKWPNHVPVVKYERPNGIEEAMAEMKLDEKNSTILLETAGISKFNEMPANRTMLAFDLKMTKHRPLNAVDHPERPERITAILSEMEPFLSKCLVKNEARPATKEELLLCHVESYLNILEDIPTMDKKDLIALQNEFNSIYCCSDSLNAAKLAVGCLLDATDEVLNKNVQNACVVIRPPGIYLFLKSFHSKIRRFDDAEN